MTKPDTRSIQTHHLSYKPEIVVSVFRGEHQVITQMGRMSKRPPSKAFLEYIERWLVCNQGKAIDLDA